MAELSRILLALVPVLGIAAGLIIAKFTKSEIKEGKTYLNFLGHILLAYVVATILEHYKLSWAIVGGVLALVILTVLKIRNDYKLIPLLAVGAILDTSSALPLFLYITTAASLDYRNVKKLGIATGLYVLVVITIGVFV